MYKHSWQQFHISLQTWNYYISEHKERFEELEDKISNDTSAHTEDSAYMFDAIWTAALALNKTKSRLDANNLTFMDFNYDDKHGISNIIYEEALRVKFFGLTVSTYSINIVTVSMYSINIVTVSMYSINIVTVSMYSINIVTVSMYSINIVTVSMYSINIRTCVCYK